MIELYRTFSEEEYKLLLSRGMKQNPRLLVVTFMCTTIANKLDNWLTLNDDVFWSHRGDS